MNIIGVIIIGICVQAIAIMMHEALHGTLFRRSLVNRWAAFFCGLPALFSGAAYKLAHLNHHRHTRTERDQDEIANFCSTPGQYRCLFYSWFILGTFLYMFIVPWKAMSIGTRAQRRVVILEYAAIIMITGAASICLIATHHVNWLLWYWVLPMQVGMILSNIRGVSEHLCTSTDSPLTSTRTTRSTRVVSFLMLNLNYHLEHHLFPGVPWYNLRKVHIALAPLYQRRHSYVERSYVRYAISSLSKGPFRENRDESSL